MKIVDRDRLLRLERAGLLKRGSRRLASKSVVAALVEDRREGR